MSSTAARSLKSVRIEEENGHSFFVWLKLQSQNTTVFFCSSCVVTYYRTITTAFV